MKKVIFFMMVVMMMVACAVVAQAKEKQFVTVNGQKYLRCQPVAGYHKKPIEGIVGDKNEWWSITMDPVAQWNAPSCLARGDELLFRGGVPVANKICNNPIVASHVVTHKVITHKTEVAQGTCGDDPWPAVYQWADFPEGAIGTETQLRPEINGFKYKLVTRKGNYIYAVKCFKKTRLWSLSELGQRWGKSFAPFKTFGNTGDGGKFATLVIGITQ
jgi:hypothetical protein